MDSIPQWFRSAFGKRVEELGKKIRSKEGILNARKEEVAAFTLLKDSFTPEQHQLFAEWEERLGILGAAEREELYLFGFMDGIRMYTALDGVARDVV